MSEQNVIHDLGYRHWEGRRAGRGARVAYLLGQGWKAAYGIGRTWRGKVVPWILVGMLMIPVTISVGAQLMFPIITDPVFQPARVPYAFQLISILFAATQAPVLFSADLRNRTIVHYLSRPLTRLDYVVARWGALTAALTSLQALAVLVLGLGWWLDGGPWRMVAGRIGTGLLGSFVVAALVAALAGLIASWTPRKGVATAVISGVLLLLSIAASIISAILRSPGDARGARIADWVPVMNPFTLVERVVRAVSDSPVLAQAPTDGAALAMAGILLLLGGGLVAGLWLRYRKVG